MPRKVVWAPLSRAEGQFPDGSQVALWENMFGLFVVVNIKSNGVKDKDKKDLFEKEKPQMSG